MLTVTVRGIWLSLGTAWDTVNSTGPGLETALETATAEKVRRYTLAIIGSPRYSRSRLMAYRLVPTPRLGMDVYVPDMFVIRRATELLSGRVYTNMDVDFGEGGGYGLGTGFGDDFGGGWGEGWGYAATAGDGRSTTDGASRPFKEPE